MSSRKRQRAKKQAHAVKGNLYRLSLVFTAVAFVFFMIGIMTRYGTPAWIAFGILGILFLAAAVTAHQMHQAKKEDAW